VAAEISGEHAAKAQSKAQEDLFAFLGLALRLCGFA
jgi:hypothetical protein